MSSIEEILDNMYLINIIKKLAISSNGKNDEQRIIDKYESLLLGEISINDYVDWSIKTVKDKDAKELIMKMKEVLE